MHFIPHRENVNPIWVPQIGQKFRNLDDAWTFWLDYGGWLDKTRKYKKKVPNKTTVCC